MCTQKQKDNWKKYYQKHKQQAKARSKKYRQEHKQQYKKYDKKYRQGHKQQIIERNKKYSKNYYKKNKKKTYSPPEIGCEHQPMLRYETKYQIYQNGQVWSYKTGKWKKVALQSNGRYYFYCLSIGGYKNKTQYVHRLIAENFILNDLLPKSYQVHHQDKNTKNNLPSNLQVIDSLTHKTFHNSRPRK